AGPSVQRGLKGPATISNAHAIVSSWSCLMSDCVSPEPAHCPQLMLACRPRLGIGYTGTHHETTPVRIHARGENGSAISTSTSCMSRRHFFGGKPLRVR